MANTLKNLDDVYKKWESKSAPNISQRGRSPHNFNRRNQPRQIVRSNQRKFEPHQKGQGRPPLQARRPRYRDLAQFKMSPSVNPLNKTRPFMGLSCTKCTPLSRAAVPHPYISSLPVSNILVIPSGACNLPVILEFWVPFYYIYHRNSHFSYPNISYDILENERYLSAAQVDEDFDGYASPESFDVENENPKLVEETSHIKKDAAKKILSSMKSTISPFFLRMASWILHRVFGSILSSVQVHKGHIEILKAANQDDIPIIYIPMHRSHLDYILISFILFMSDLKAPLVAAGDNLRMPVFGSLMRRLGAFFVRRRLDPEHGKKDHVYRAVLQAYITECLKAGHSMEIFIEGGRSRNGKSRMPKTGLLSFVVDSVMRGDIDDAYISAVSISYEKIVEGNFLGEQLGKEKEPENFFSTVRYLWTTMHSYFGSVRVDFGQPFSLKEFLHKDKLPHILSSNKVPNPSIDTPPSSPTSSSSSSGSICGKGAAQRNLRTLVDTLANHIVYDSASAAALMSTQLVAFLLLTKHRNGATQQQLLCSFDWLRQELLKRKRDVGFTGGSLPIIKHALQLLGKDLIVTETREWPWWRATKMENTTLKYVIYIPVVELPHVIELQYYANAVAPVFLLDSIVINALYALLDADICYYQLCDSKFSVPRQALVDKAKELCMLFQFEFLFTPPCGDLVSSINDVLDELVFKECLHISGAIKHVGASLSKMLVNRKNCYSFEPSDEEEDFEVSTYSQQLKIDLTEESIDYLKFMRNVASPFVESYWVASCTLLKLIHTTMEESDLLKAIQKTAEDKLSHGLLHFEESFGMEVMKNALKLFQFWKVIDYTYQGNSKVFYIIRQCDIEYSDIEQSDSENEQCKKVQVSCSVCTETVSNVISRIEEYRK